MTDASYERAGIKAPRPRLLASPLGEARRSLSPVVLVGLARAAEFGACALVGALVYALYLLPTHGLRGDYAVAIPLVSLLVVVVLQALDLYHLGAYRAVARSGLRLVGGWCLAFLIAFAAVFFLKLEGVYSRVFFASWFAGGLFALMGARFGIGAAVRGLTERGRLDRRTAIVGGGGAGERLLKALDQDGDQDLRVLGVFDDRTDERSPDACAGYPKLGSVDDLVAYARTARLDLVIFTLPIAAEARILTMLRKLCVLPVDIRLAAHSGKLRFRPRNYSYVGRVPMFDMADKPIADWDVVIKAAFDRAVGAVLLLAFSPLMLLVALAVKLDSPGPVFFKQRRYGFDNELIEVFKFRSMRVDQCDATASKLVTRGDPRVTRVGRLIRKTSLDELPQLLNVVLKGNLSLVGPRPHALHAKAAGGLYDEVVDGYFARHRVKPGITGWAQVNGWRGETDTAEKIQRRVEHDLHYIENWSVFFDLAILAMTPFALARTGNAY